MTPKVQRWGNSLAVRIPAPLARQLGLVDGRAVEIEVEKGRVIIEPVHLVPTLDDLLAGIRPDNQHHDLDWSPADQGSGGS